jgi:EmrB/QacA subfamily drug resistance transporter
VAPAPSWTRQQRGTLVATGLGLFMLFLDAMVVNVALPDIQKDLGGGESALQWIVAAYSLGMAVFIMSAASTADRIGRRRLYYGALIVFTVASVTCGAAPALWVLVLARGVQGVAAAALNVASLALVSAAFPEARAKAKAIGLWTAIATLGLALGPTVGGIGTSVFGWRSVFFANLPMGVLAFVLTGRFVEESRDPAARTLDWAGQAMFVVGFGALSYGLIEAPHSGWLSPEILGLFGAAAVLLVSMVLYELRARHPMMDVRLFADPPYATALVIVFFSLAGAYGMLLVVSQYLQNVRDESPLHAGVMLFAFTIPAPFVAVYEGRLVERYGPRVPSLVGTAFVVIGLATLAVSVGTTIVGLLVGLVLLGIGVGANIPATTAIAMSTVEDERAGMASGMLSAQRGLGSTVGFAMMGSIVAIWLGSHLPPALDKVVPKPAERARVVREIKESANPRAHIGGIGSRHRIRATSTSTAQEVRDAADGVFADGVRIALGVGAACAASALFLGYRYLPKGQVQVDPESAAAGG